VVAAAEMRQQLALSGQRRGGVLRQAVGRSNEDSNQVGPRTHGETSRPPHNRLALLSTGERHHDALFGLPMPLDPVEVSVLGDGFIDSVRRPRQRELTEGAEVARAEVVGECGVDSLRLIDLSGGQPLPNTFLGEVHELDLVGPAHDVVRDRLALHDIGDLEDDVVERVEVLDVDRRQHVDLGIEQLVDILPSLCVARTGDVAVRQLVDQRHLGSARQDGIEVHLLEYRPTICERPPRDDLETPDHGGGLCSLVGLDESDDDVPPCCAEAVSFLQHGERLPDAGCSAQEHLQSAAAHTLNLVPRLTTSAALGAARDGARLVMTGNRGRGSA
jgi:hypothetical protein